MVAEFTDEERIGGGLCAIEIFDPTVIGVAEAKFLQRVAATIWVRLVPKDRTDALADRYPFQPLASVARWKAGNDDAVRNVGVGCLVRFTPIANVKTVTSCRTGADQIAAR
ncbi:hypothetical protein [Agrobacterium rosae]|uniref:Uncharacterized protein n=1 Tax=Agrobacterium rosae TaxID=1972867 RepID=A0AAW9FED5_9HYPH|nr:hypothetical protein [Agrobacterium rosae]MDX8301496.1 hypothetical protein [Agrobacterium rosae]